jgi:hypothetical protein
MTAEEKYKTDFDSKSVNNCPSKAERALQHALDIRKFEIGLYWQRATYFWTLIAATFAGHFAVLSAEHMKDKEFNAFVISCVGAIFSLAWFLANRGSKYWQENWEIHVDMLENEIAGPLYKTVLHKQPTKCFLAKHVEGPAPYSVSKINQWVSLFTITVWCMLISNVLPEFNWSHQISIKHAIIGAFTVLAALAMFFRAKSKIFDNTMHTISNTRTTVIDG